APARGQTGRRGPGSQLPNWGKHGASAQATSRPSRAREPVLWADATVPDPHAWICPRHVFWRLGGSGRNAVGRLPRGALPTSDSLTGTASGCDPAVLTRPGGGTGGFLGREVSLRSRTPGNWERPVRGGAMGTAGGGSGWT